MLQVKAEFPHAGSTAFLRGTGQRVTVIQYNAGSEAGPQGHRTATVKLERPRFLTPEQRIEWNHKGASLTTRVPATDLYATEDAAVHLGRKPRLRRRGR